MCEPRSVEIKLIGEGNFPLFRCMTSAPHTSAETKETRQIKTQELPIVPPFPALRSGHRHLQRLSPQKQYHSN